jgi:hypothetical protein
MTRDSVVEGLDYFVPERNEPDFSRVLHEPSNRSPNLLSANSNDSGPER